MQKVPPLRTSHDKNKLTYPPALALLTSVEGWGGPNLHRIGPKYDMDSGTATSRTGETTHLPPSSTKLSTLRYFRFRIALAETWG